MKLSLSNSQLLPSPPHCNLPWTNPILPVLSPAIKSGPNQMRKYRVVGLVALLVLFALVVSSTRSAEQEEGEKAAMADGGPLVGGVQDVPAGTDNDLLVNDLARFAVEEHNKKANALLQFEKVVKVKKQVVAGTMYFLTIEAKDGEVKKVYEAKVWEKPWENFKELQEFKPAEVGASA